MDVLLDLDGTLVDPGAGFVACIAYALARVGGPALPPEVIRGHVGPPLRQTLARLLGGDAARAEVAARHYQEVYPDRGIPEVVVYEGVEPALESLRRAGHRLFLATSKPHVFADRILVASRLAHHFDGVYGSELDGTRSDKGEVIAEALRGESVVPASAVMVGDRAQDVQGALRNRVRPLGALWGYGSREELSLAGAAALVPRPADLPALIGG